MPRNGVPNQREAIILAILINGEKFGREIRDAYEERSGQSMPLGSLYVTLDRMVAEGFVRAREGESNPERGGNRRRYFRLTASGTTALNRFQQQLSPLLGVTSHG